MSVRFLIRCPPCAAIKQNAVILAGSFSFLTASVTAPFAPGILNNVLKIFLILVAISVAISVAFPELALPPGSSSNKPNSSSNKSSSSADNPGSFSNFNPNSSSSSSDIIVNILLDFNNIFVC